MYFQNANGLSLRNQGVDIDFALQYLQEKAVSVLGFAEPNLNLRQNAMRDRLLEHFKLSWNQCRLQTGSSGENTKSTYQPGGTVIAACGKWVARVKDTGADKLGRWS